jgi:hypothetical protein
MLTRADLVRKFGNPVDVQRVWCCYGAVVGIWRMNGQKGDHDDRSPQQQTARFDPR